MAKKQIAKKDVQEEADEMIKEDSASSSYDIGKLGIIEGSGEDEGGADLDEYEEMDDSDSGSSRAAAGLEGVESFEDLEENNDDVFLKDMDVAEDSDDWPQDYQ